MAAPPPSPDANVYRGALAGVAILTGIAAIHTGDALYALVTVIALVALVAMSPTAPRGDS